MSTSKISVLVTGVGGGGHGHEVVKSLRYTDRYTVIGTDMNWSSIGFTDCHTSYVVPSASSDKYLDTLLSICKKHCVKVIIHGSEPELIKISEHRKIFLEHGILPLVNSADVINLCMDKFETIKRLSAHGIESPRTVTITQPQEIPSDFVLPAIIKPVIGGGGSNNTYIVQDQQELVFAAQILLRQGLIVLLQEYVGTPDDEFTVGVLHSLDGDLISSLALRRTIMSGLSNRIKVKNRTDRSELSPVLAVSSGVSQGEIDDFPAIRQQCENIASLLQSKGPLNIQCRVIGGKVFVFEINPRFSGTTFMRTLAGVNEPDLLIRKHVLHENIPDIINFQKGWVVRGLREHFVTSKLADIATP